MTQRLILPIDNCQINAGYKSAQYKKEWGFTHYGIDLVERNKQRRIYASGEGRVIACGMDGATDKERMGNCVVVVYDNVVLGDGRQMSVACRMFHLAVISCKAGDRVQAGTVLGEYGSTGANSSGAHLHVEFDSDVKYPSYAAGLARDGNVIKRGTVDSTIDPCKVFWLGQGQSIYAPPAWISEGWVAADSVNLPSLPDTALLETENKRLRSILAAIHDLSVAE